MPDRDPLGLLQRAVEQTGAIIAQVRPGQAGLPTPCTDWDVRTLVNHTVYDLNMFADIVAGRERRSPGADLIGDDWSAAYRAAADGLIDAWRKRGTDGTFKSQMGELPATWALGQHLSNIAVHGWDIATATDQKLSLDEEVGREGLAWGRHNLKPQFRGQTFAPEVEVPTDAPVYEQLAGFFGRHPAAI